MTWRYFIPDDHGKDVPTAEDMTVLKGTFPTPWHAAQAAVEDDWDNHDGWERGCDKPFDFVVVDPDGTMTTFTGNNEASVDHTANQKWETNDG